MPGCSLRTPGVIHIYRRMVRRSLRVDEHRRDAKAVQGFERAVVRAETEADEAVDRGLPYRSLQRAVKRRNQEHGQVVFVAQLAEALAELAQEGIGEDSGQTLGNEQADGSASTHRQGTGCRVRGVTEVVGDLEDALEGGVAKLARVVEGKGNGGFGHACSARHVSDRHACHLATTRAHTTKSIEAPPSLNRFSKAVYGIVFRP